MLGGGYPPVVRITSGSPGYPPTHVVAVPRFWEGLPAPRRQSRTCSRMSCFNTELLCNCLRARTLPPAVAATPLFCVGAGYPPVVRTTCWGGVPPRSTYYLGFPRVPPNARSSSTSFLGGGYPPPGVNPAHVPECRFASILNCFVIA